MTVYLSAGPVYSLEHTSRSVLLAENAPVETPRSASDDSTRLEGVSSSLAGGGVVAGRNLPPSSIMYRSMVLPGWGQLENGKKKKALFFIAAEAFFIGGIIYEQSQLSEKGLSRFERDQILSNRNTYIIYLLGARLFGMVDAYVDAHLRDFNVRDIAPEELKTPDETPPPQ